MEHIANRLFGILVLALVILLALSFWFISPLETIDEICNKRNKTNCPKRENKFWFDLKYCYKEIFKIFKLSINLIIFGEFLDE